MNFFDRFTLAYKAFTSPHALKSMVSNNDFDWKWGTSGGYDSNLDMRADEYGAALAYTTNVAIMSAIKVWENWLEGKRWEIRDGNTDKVLVDSDMRKVPDGAKGARFYRAVKFHREYFRHSYFKSLAFSDKLYGESYVYRVNNLAGNPTGLQWLNPLITEPQITGGKIHYFRYSGDAGSINYSPDVIAYRIANRDPDDDLRGQSPVLSAIDAANIEQNTKRALRGYFRNGMILGGLISPMSENVNLSPSQIAEREEKLERRFKGVGNAFRFLLLPTRMNVESFAPPDIEKNYGIIQPLRNEILMAMGVPPQLANDPSQVNYDNADDVKRGWWDTWAIPYARDIEIYHNTQILPYLESDSDCYFAFDLSDFETENPETIAGDVNAGIIDIATAQEKRGYSADESLKGIFMVNGRPMSKAVIVQLANTMPANEVQAFAQADKYEAESEQIQSTPVTSAEMEAVNPVSEDASTTKAEFSSYTMNGVTCQATGRRSSSREDKKYERTVRYNGDERTIHYGDPNMEMQRDNEEARDNFLSRHDCDSKKDPFAAGFWACYDWKNTDEKSNKALDCDCEDEHEHHHDLPSIVDYSDIAELDELAAWRKFLTNGKAHKRPFEQKALRGDIGDSIQAAVESKDKQAILDAFKNAQERIESRIKAIQATRLDFENDFDELLTRARAERMGRQQWASAMRSIIRRYGERAYIDGLTDGGVEDAPNEDDRIEINRLTAESSKYVTELGNVLYRGDGISDVQADTKAAMWFNKTIAPYYQSGLFSADANGLYEWVYGTTEHCSDCLRLNGQRHRLKGWKANYLPQSSLLECQGYNCQCKLVKTRGRPRGRY